MTTAASTPAAAEEAIAKILFEQGLSQRAIEKAIRKIRNLLSRVPTRAPTRPGANTNNQITNTVAEFDEDGRLLDLYAPTPPQWVVALIKSALKVRNFAENRWAEAWHFFRTWNLDKPDQPPKIAVRALKAWLQICKLRKPKAAAHLPQTSKTRAPMPCPDGLNRETWNYCVRKAGVLRISVEARIGKEAYEARLGELLSRGMNREEAAHRVHYLALNSHEVE